VSGSRIEQREPNIDLVEGRDSLESRVKAAVSNASLLAKCLYIAMWLTPR
jgi:hypothetical protein